MPINVMRATGWRPLATSLSAKKWRAALRADFGIRLAATADREALYVAWCEAYQASALSHRRPLGWPQPVEHTDAD